MLAHPASEVLQKFVVRIQAEPVFFLMENFKLEVFNPFQIDLRI